MNEILVIVNPAAGGGRAEKLWPLVEGRLKKGLGPFDVAHTDGPGAALRAAAEAKRYRLVVAYGGDGTIHEVANGLLCEGSPSEPSPRAIPTLGIISVGTGSDLIKSLKIPRDLLRQIETLAGARETAVDVGVVEFSGPGKRVFLNIADAGLGAEVLRRLGTSRTLFGRKLAYFSAALQAYLARHVPQMTVTIDGKKEIQEPVLIAAVANGRCFGSGMKIAPQADPKDGLLDLILVKDLKPSWLSLAIPLLYTGKVVLLPQVQMYRARQIEIESDEPVHLDIDGELVGSLPARFHIQPGAIRVKVP